MTPRCDAPVSDDDLLDYWIQAIDGKHAERIEEHLFTCGACAARLEAMASTAVGLTALVRRGRVAGIVSRALLNRLQRDGVQVRQYVLSPGDRVPCAAFPDDDLIVVAMRADFAGSDAVSVSLSDEDGSVIDQVNGIPVASSDVELLWATPGAMIRRLSTGRRRVTLRSEAPQSRIIAEYELDHTAL